MAVMFKTQQGRTLLNADLTVEEFTVAVGSLVEVTGYELGDPDRLEFHASTRHVVEWWQPPNVKQIVERVQRSLVAERLIGASLAAQVERSARRMFEATKK